MKKVIIMLSILLSVNLIAEEIEKNKKKDSNIEKKLTISLIATKNNLSIKKLEYQGSLDEVDKECNKKAKSTICANAKFRSKEVKEKLDNISLTYYKKVILFLEQKIKKNELNLKDKSYSNLKEDIKEIDTKLKKKLSEIKDKMNQIESSKYKNKFSFSFLDDK